MREQNRAFTLVELAVVVAVVGMLAACLLPALAGTRTQAGRLYCADNLRQVGVAFRTWSAAHGNMMPMQIPGAPGGAAEEVNTARTLSANQLISHGACKIFLCLSNELSTPKLLFCPAEYETHWRQAATTFRGVGGKPGTVPYTNDFNISYFVAADASELFPRMLLTGDHHLGGNANPPTIPYLAAPATGYSKLSLGTNFNPPQGPAFMDNMHFKQGNVGMADGSVEWFSRTNLRSALQNSGDRGRPSGLFTLALSVASGAGCNRILLP